MSGETVICADCLRAEALELSAGIDSVQWRLSELYRYFDRRGYKKAMRIERRLRRMKQTLDWMAETLQRGGH